MRTFITSLLIACAAITGVAVPTDTVHVADFGVKPHSYENCTSQMREAIDYCRKTGARVLSFAPGRYDIWPEGAERREYFISNTSSESECPSKVKTIGMLFEDLDGLTIEGNGAMLMFHGKMITMAFTRCRNIRLHNVQIDFERPGGSEMTYTRVEPGYVELKVHPDTRYDIADKRLHIYGEGWRSNVNYCIKFDPRNEHFTYSHDLNRVLAVSDAVEVAPHVIGFHTPRDFSPAIGETLTIRDIIRDHVGMFINECENVTLDSVNIYYMHGLGIVGQYTRTISLSHVRCEPREGSGRVLASSADFMHFSGCSGKITVADSRFVGAQDDPLNVHGTNLRVVERHDARTLTLRFMHGQSYGYRAFFEGDTVALVRPSTMQRYATACVTGTERLSDRLVKVSLDRDVPDGLELNSDCVENLTCTPEVEVRRCYFDRIFTKGVMTTTPRKVVIADNTFRKIGRNAILLEGDSKDWYESGPVNDILIENNVFEDCVFNGGPGNAFIATNPSNTVVDPQNIVHRNIRIIGNTFRTTGNAVLYGKSTGDIQFRNNRVETTADAAARPQFIFEGCRNVVVRDNSLPSGVTSADVETKHMSGREVKWKNNR